MLELTIPEIKNGSLVVVQLAIPQLPIELETLDVLSMLLLESDVDLVKKIPFSFLLPNLTSITLLSFFNSFDCSFVIIKSKFLLLPGFSSYNSYPASNISFTNNSVSTP